jgi:anti-sigma factor RsiW
MAGDDTELVALIDNELGETAREQLLARLEQDEAMRERFEALRHSRSQIVAAFDSLLEQAPLARLRALLPPFDTVVARPPRRAPVSWWNLAAVLAVGLVLGAAVAVGFGFSEEKEESDWRRAVVEYMQLYTPDTFASQNPDTDLAAAELKGVGDKVGVALTPENTAVKDLRFRVAFNLAYAGAPLAEVGFTDARGEPAAFCVIANGERTSPLRTLTRDGVSYATWSKDGKGYILIARMSEAQVAEMARPLEARF